MIADISKIRWNNFKTCNMPDRLQHASDCHLTQSWNLFSVIIHIHVYYFIIINIQFITVLRHWLCVSDKICRTTSGWNKLGTVWLNVQSWVSYKMFTENNTLLTQFGIDGDHEKTVSRVVEPLAKVDAYTCQLANNYTPFQWWAELEHLTFVCRLRYRCSQ